jgi:uncharacterized protein with NAD-binding domain and iron-sulfur cluster
MHDAVHQLREVEPPEHAAVRLKALDKVLDAFLTGLEKLLGADDDSDMADVFERLLKFARPLLHLGDSDGPGPDEPMVCRFLRVLTDVVWALTDGDRYAMTFDLTATVFRGILADHLDDESLGGFAQVNDIEFTSWLAKHDARPETLAGSPILRAFYQLCFAYEDGDRERPCVAAGKALQAMLRMCLGYRGAIMWKMQAGMGDAIFAPLYEVLKARGVRFEFFSEIVDVGASADGTKVETLTVRRQAELASGATEYDPLIHDAGGLPSWPAEPCFEQLVGGADALRHVRFEACESAPGARDRTLRVGEDFDAVVLGISLASLPDITRSLAATDPKFAGALEHGRTVATQALQVWMTRSPKHLGVDPPGMVSGGFVKPLDTLCDMSHLLPREAWPEAAGVTSIGYFCGTMKQPEDDTQEAADARALEEGLQHLREHACVLWPGAEAGDGFDWELLYDHAGGATGPDRIHTQYWRANIFGSERYVITPPGSVEHRIRPSEAKAANLAFAGDWTRNGVCGGSVEAAVTSGKLAARHLSGSPAVVPGTEGWLECD